MPKQIQPDYLLVEKQSEVEQLGAELKMETAIGVDLEADSMFHYQEQVCLIQISTQSRNILVNTLALDDLSPLSPVFSDPGINKVFHGSDYDIRSLFRDFNIEVNALFDTQIAAKFLGIKSTGLANLLDNYFGVVLEKKYQKSDWSKRPISQAMLSYAIQDSCYLLSLAEILKKELEDNSRFLWVLEECQILSKVRPAPSTNDPLFLKFKGAGSLDGRGLAIIEEILKLRENIACKRDCPPFKVLGNHSILRIAKQRLRTEKEFMEQRVLSQKQIKSFGRLLVSKVSLALRYPEEELPFFPRKPRSSRSPQVSVRIKALRRWREDRAAELEIEPSSLLTNAQIYSLSEKKISSEKELSAIEGIRDWQRITFGHEICPLLRK